MHVVYDLKGSWKKGLEFPENSYNTYNNNNTAVCLKFCFDIRLQEKVTKFSVKQR